MRASENILSTYRGVRVLVLGSAGFVGRWVARRLCREGAVVTLQVRDGRLARKTFDGYEITGDLTELDLYDSESVKRLLRELKPEITFNLAGYGVDRSETVEDQAYRINCELVRTICDAAPTPRRSSSWQGRDLVHTGTAMEYGSMTGNLEEHSPTRPTTLYGRSKLAGTQVLTDSCKRSGFDGVTARLFAVYGPGELPQRLLPTLIAASRGDEPIEFTAGLHKRDFTFVDDVAQGLLRLGLTRGPAGEVVNLATGRLTSVRRFVETAAAALGIETKRLAFGELPTRKEEMEHDPVSINRLIERTGWRPSTSIEEGVRQTFEFESSFNRVGNVLEIA